MEYSRNRKRAFIIFVLIMIPVSIGVVSFLLFKAPPSCKDKKMNQNEKGIDCGGPCKPCIDFSATQELSVKSKEFVPSGSGKYDGLVRVSNPNANAGFSYFSYKASLKDAGGNVIDEKTGSSFLLPTESKYIIIMGFSVGENQTPQDLDFSVSDEMMMMFTDYQQPTISVNGKKFNPIQGVLGGEVYAIIKNESLFDFDLIKVNVVLRDYSNKVMAVGSTQMNTVREGEERDFRLNWPNQDLGNVKNVEVEAEVDTYNESNFLDAYKGEEILQFQK